MSFKTNMMRDIIIFNSLIQNQNQFICYSKKRGRLMESEKKKDDQNFPLHISKLPNTNCMITFVFLVRYD